MTSIESTMASQINLNSSNNDEESIFLSSSDDDKDHESVDRDEYLAQEHLDENAGYDDDASDNDDFAYGNSYDDDDAGRERRPIKVYDEYDPENIDNNEEYSDDDDIPLNMYSRKKKQLEASEKPKEDSDVEELDQSSSDEERRPKKRGRPKRAQELAACKKPRGGRKSAAKPLSARKKPARTAANSDSDSSSSVESDSKSKQARKNPTKENVNTDSSIKNLVKKPSSNNNSASLATTLHNSKQKTSKLSQAQNIISGRVINFESGFKIPKRPSNETSSNEKEPPEKKTKTEPFEKTKTKDSKETVKQKTSSKPSAQVSKNSIDKKTDKKIQPVKNGFKESVDFLEALSSSSTRKHSHSSKKPAVPGVARVETAKNESSQDLKKPEPSLKTNLESTCNSTPCLINRVESVDTSDSTSLLNNSHSTITTTTNTNTTTTTSSTTTTISTISTSGDTNLLKLNSNGLKSNLIISGSKKVAKKKVIWADSCSQQLESVQFFYLDETERVIKKEAYHGADMSKVDKLSEKEYTFRITSGHGFADFNEETASTWPASLLPIDLPESTIIPDIKSIERDIQAKREATTLAVLVFKKFMPDSASEPDPEPAGSEPPSTKLIPLDEVNGTDAKLSDVPESDNSYTPSQEASKAKPALLSNPTAKTPLLPTPPPVPVPPVQPPSSSSEASGSKTEPANILNMLNLSNLSSSLLRSNEDAERLKKILSLVGTADSVKSTGDEKVHEFDHTSNKNSHIPKTDTNNNPRWNNNTNWQTNKYSNQTFNRNYNQNSNQNANNNNNNNNNNYQGRNVFVNNFKRGIGNRGSGSFGRDGHAHNYRGNDSRAGFNRQNYAMHGQNRSRFGENKNYQEESDRGVESKSTATQGGRWI